MSEIDREEKDLLTSYERGEWRSVAELGAEMDRYREYARDTFKKGRRVDVHLSGDDLEAIQERAIEEGMPYQTLMSSILHKYICGQLIENHSSVQSSRSRAGSSDRGVGEGE